MALERMQVTNHERWGNLVKTWSTGKNYLDDDNEYPIPTTIEEFKEQLAKAQVFMTVPERYTKVQFVEQHMDTVVVRLPPACFRQPFAPPHPVNTASHMPRIDSTIPVHGPVRFAHPHS